MSYIELHTSSAFSFLRAASLPETLIDRAAMLGYPAVALLDRDGVSGAPRFHKAALAAGIRPLIGAELSIETNREPGTGNREPRQTFALPVLCASQEGWRNLCRLLSKMKLRAPKGEGALASGRARQNLPELTAGDPDADGGEEEDRQVVAGEVGPQAKHGDRGLTAEDEERHQVGAEDAAPDDERLLKIASRA